MKANWILEETCHEETIDDLKQSLVRQGLEFKAFQYIPFTEMFPKTFLPTDCVVFHGSIQAAKIVQRHSSFTPGAWMNSKEMECQHYYAHLGQYLLNGDYIMLPFNELKRRKDFLFDTLGDNGYLFVRPNSGSKSFTGQIVEANDWDKSVDGDLGFYGVDAHSLCVVARPVNISREWRFIVAQGQVITGSLYRENRQMVRKLNDCQEATDYAQMIANTGFSPDPVWVCDIAETHQGLRLLEIGGFSCAGLYKCDTDIIAEEVSRVAVEEWKEIHEI